MALAEPKIIEPPAIEVAPALSDSPQRWWLLVLLFSAMLKAFIIVGLAIGCLIVPAGMVANKISAVWLLTISLCGLGICSSNTWTLTQAVCNKKLVGTVSGIQNFGGNLGGILAPALTGFIAHVTDSFALAFGLCGVILVVGMFAYWFLISDSVELSDKL